MDRSFLEMLVASFEQRPDKVAMRVVGSEDEVYTFAEMLRHIRSVAYRLGQEGIEFGDRVALIGENHPAWAIAYLATLYHGAVCVPMDPHGEIETITNFIENSEAKLAFLSPDQTQRFSQIEEKLARHIPAVVWNLDTSANGFERFSDWTEGGFPDAYASEPPRARDKDLALLIYTSGTTGTPKGVPLTHGNIVGELSGVNDVLTISDKDKILSLLPLFHAYLQIVNLWVATTFGVEVGYLKELTPSELAESMKVFRPTILTTVPRLWYVFHKKIFDAVEAKPAPVRALFRTMLATNGMLRNTLGVNLGRKFFKQVHESFGGNLRIAVSAGSRFDEKVAADFYNLGFTIIQGYGLTETSGAATATYETDNRVGSVGKPMKGAEIKIADPDANGVGEVLIRGTMVFDGYYKNPTATAEAFTEDGWFRSGDLGKLDKDGHLYIVGRAKDVIVLPSGKNVHPEDIEVHYLKCPLVEEMAVIGIEDKTEARAGAERLAAVIVPDFNYLKQTNVSNSKEAIRHALDNLGRELPEYQRVRDYIIRVEPLPRTATNKVKRFQLKKEVESGVIAGEPKEKKAWQLNDADTTLLESPVGRAVVTAIRQNSPDVREIHPSMNLEIDLGLDSLARAETFAALEQAYSTEFTADEAARALTVREVIDLVNSHGGESAELVSVDLNWGSIVREADGEFPEVRTILKNRPAFAGFAFFVYRCFNLFCRVFMRLEVEGVENLERMVDRQGKNPATGVAPFLICPNHQSFLDPFVLCSNYPFRLFRNIFHVGASEFFRNSFMRFVARMLSVVPVNPDTELMRAMKAGAIGLKNGKVLNIYPEGERAFDGDLHQFKKGAAILASELDLPIVPVALDGLHKVWARRSLRIRPAKVRIRIGEPIYPREIAGRLPADVTDEERYEAITAELKNRIAMMIAQMRGVEPVQTDT
jgi:long-chain acyl-CoA synthetase